MRLRLALFCTAALVPLCACLPAYDNHFMGITNPDGGDDGGGAMCADSGQVVSGRFFTWGPMPNTAGFRAGVMGSVQGYDCLMGPASTDIAFSIPIPQAVLGDGQKHFLSLTGNVMGTPVLRTISGPIVLDGSDALDHMLIRHFILDQTGGMRDTINQELALTTGSYSFIHGATVSKSNQYNGSTVTVTAPASSVAKCKVYYTHEFALGSTVPFIMTGAASIFDQTFLVICPMSETGPVTLHATDGTAADLSTASFPDLTMPLSTTDAVFAEWSPL